jgi:hypothetical protein
MLNAQQIQQTAAWPHDRLVGYRPMVSHGLRVTTEARG